MDFKTLKGLAIPEGKVTQIADANGNVLWKQAPTIGTCYLRPSADISVGDNSTYAYPSGSAFYQCLDEEVADGDATYIYTTAGGFQYIQMSGVLPTNAKITDAKVVFVFKMQGEYTGYVNLNTLTINGTEYSVGAGTGSVSPKTYTEYSIAVDADGSVGVIDALNSANANGSIVLDAKVFPFVSAPLEDKTGSTTLYVTQMFIELTYEA